MATGNAKHNHAYGYYKTPYTQMQKTIQNVPGLVSGVPNNMVQNMVQNNMNMPEQQHQQHG